MGNTNNKQVVSPVRPEPKITRAWNLADRFHLYQDEVDNIYFHHPENMAGMDRIIFVERIKDTILYIGVYNETTDHYTKHVLIRSNNGDLIWEFPCVNKNLLEKGCEVFSTNFYHGRVKQIHPDTDQNENPKIKTIIEFFNTFRNQE